MNGTGANHSRFNINTGTSVSIGLIIVAIGGFAWVMAGINENHAEIQALKNMDEKTDLRLRAIETAKNTWSATSMLKWAIHLQQSNSDPKKLQAEGLKVPEPEVDSK